MVSIVASTSKSANSRAMCPSKSAPRSEFEFAAGMDLSPLGPFLIFIRFSPRIAFSALFMSDLSDLTTHPVNRMPALNCVHMYRFGLNPLELGNDIGLGGNELLLDSVRWPLRGVGPQLCPEQEAEAHRVEEPQGAQSCEIGLSSRFSK